MNHKLTKKLTKNEISELLREIKKFAEENKKNNNDDYNKLSNKDILFYFLTQINTLNNRVTKVEVTQKMLMWFIGITVSIIGLMLVIL